MSCNHCKKERCHCQRQQTCQPEQIFLTEVKNISGIAGIPVPKWDTPFYDTTVANHFITIPELGSFFFVDVPLPDRWTVGQWVYIENVGYYPISSIQGKSIVLHNVPGVDNNPDPGSQFIGRRKLWLTTERLTLSEDLLGNIESALQNEDFSFQANVAAATAAMSGNPLGAQVTTDECNTCNQDNPLQTAVRQFFTWTNIVYKWLTLSLPMLPKTNRNSVTFFRSGVEVTEPIRPVMWNPQSGDLYSMDIPTYNAVQVFYGGVWYWLPVPADYASSFYSLAPDPISGQPTWVKTIPDLPNDFANSFYTLVPSGSGYVWSKLIPDLPGNFASVTYTLSHDVDGNLEWAQ